MGVALSLAGVSLGNSFCFGGDAGVVERYCGAPLAGVAGGFASVFPSVLAKSLPKNEPFVGVADFAESSSAVPLDLNVVPSWKPPFCRPNTSWDAGVWGVGVASSLFRSCVPFAPLMSESFESNEAVLKEDLSGCPNNELLCCAGVLPQEGSDDPVPDPTVTVEPKLDSLLRLAKPDFCWPCPSDANPEPACAEPVLPKLEKDDVPPFCPNLANPEEPVAVVEKGLFLASEF